MEKWEIFQWKKSLEEKRIVLPNATVGKSYRQELDLSAEEWNEVVISDINGLEHTGLAYDTESNTLTGIPLVSADLKLVFNLIIAGESMEKKVPFAINPDPRSLWKTIDTDRDAPWWKPDEQLSHQALGSKSLVAASKRGRAHANVGKFREDHYACATAGKRGWHTIAVSDGAGSADLSRLGSKIACEAAVSYFNHLPDNAYDELETLSYGTTLPMAEPSREKLQKLAVKLLSPAVLEIHAELSRKAISIDASLADLHATLALCLIKQFQNAWVILTFSVGDCPIGLISSNEEEVSVLNWLDTGDYGGATRFLTMPEILEQPDFHTRFSASIVSDFSYLMMMSDGIYDAKFETAFNLSQPKIWKQLIADLKGENPDGHQVDLVKENPDVATQLSSWMDFWSTGNHDDRTLVIIY